MAKGRSVRLTRSRPESHFPRHDDDSAGAGRSLCPGRWRRAASGWTSCPERWTCIGCICTTAGELSRRRQAERVRAVVERRLQRLAWRLDPGEEILSESLRASETGELSPYAVAERIVKEPGVHPR
jgi:hypothetical protein